jgi:ABC-type phosphate/phosphonate transport system substrate-binding protein
MAPRISVLPRPRWFFGFLAGIILLAPSMSGSEGQQARLDKLLIGTTLTMTGKANSAKEKAGIKTLQSFIKEETGLNSAVQRHNNWREVADQISRGKLHLAVFPGHAFAWAQEKHPELRPLAVAVNVHRYPAVHVLARRDNPARDFAALRGQSLLLPVPNQDDFQQLYLERQCRRAGTPLKEFFSKVEWPDNVEDALDDVVDGKAQVIAVDGAAFEAYQRRKPGRFRQLKEVTRSQPFPPGVIAYYGSVLDDATLRRFKAALLGAARKPKGQTLLTLCRLTGFETVPDDFQRVLAETLKAYPPEIGKK